MINKSDPVKIFVTYGEAIELKNAGIADSFYKYFSHFKIPEDQDLYLIETGFDFDRKWLGELLKKNHFDDSVISAFIMYDTIIPAIMVSPPINPTNLKDIVDREFSEQKKYFNNCLKSLDIENIIERFCLPTPFFYPKTKIKNNSFFFWVDYGYTIMDEAWNMLRDEAIKGNDLCFQVALLEFGNQDNDRLSDEWNDLIQPIFPDKSFYLSKYPLKDGTPIKKAFLNVQGEFSDKVKPELSTNYLWAANKFWESLKKYNPGKGSLKNWIAEGIKFDLLNQYKKNDIILRRIDPEIIEDEPDPEYEVKESFNILNKNPKLTLEDMLGKVADLKSPKEKDIAKSMKISPKTIQRYRKKHK